jgi:hypothetical protein
MFQRLLLLFTALLLTACGKSGGGSPTPTPYPAGETPSTIKVYVEEFKARYGVQAEYPILYDTDSETGGSGSGGTTVGVCRMWSSGHRDVLINREWWLARTRYPNSSGYVVYGTDFSDDGTAETKSYSVPGSFQQRNNTLISLRSIPNYTGLTAAGITGSSNLSLEKKSCSSGANSVCRADVYINELENMAPGTYSESVYFGSKTVNINFTIVANTGAVTTGEIFRKVLVFHEMGHCSFNLKHNCNTVNQSGSDVRCPGTNSSDDPGNYTVATEGPAGNRPLSLMYPTVNPQAYFYQNGYASYYEQELYDSRVGSVFVGSQPVRSEESELYSPLTVGEDESHPEGDHDHPVDENGIPLDDGIRHMP